MVGEPYYMSLKCVKEQEEYNEILRSIISLAHNQVAIIGGGGSSCWTLGQLELGVIPEMEELQHYVLNGKILLKYGEHQRLLESSYLLTDSLNILNRTPIGIQISKLQDKINSQKQ